MDSEKQINESASTENNDSEKKSVWKKNRGGYSSFQEIEVENNRLKNLFYFFKDVVDIKEDSTYFEDVLNSRERENRLLKSKIIVRNCDEKSVINHRLSIIWEKSY